MAMRTSTLAMAATIVVLAGIALQGPLNQSLNASKITAAEVHSDRWVDFFGAVDAGISAGAIWSQSEPEDVSIVIARMHERTVRSLRKMNYRSDLVAVDPLQHDPEARMVTLTVSIKNSMTLGYLNNLEARFYEELCGPWLASPLGKSGYSLRVAFERAERAFIFGRIVSEQSCRQFRAYQDSRA